MSEPGTEMRCIPWSMSANVATYSAEAGDGGNTGGESVGVSLGLAGPQSFADFGHGRPVRASVRLYNIAGNHPW